MVNFVRINNVFYFKGNTKYFYQVSAFGKRYGIQKIYLFSAFKCQDVLLCVSQYNLYFSNNTENIH